MEESENHDEAILAVSRSSSPKFDINKIFLPIAIVVAGVMISGTLLYTSGKGTGGGTAAIAESVLTADNFKKWAKDVGVKDTKKFEQCVQSEQYKAEIESDIAAGSASGVNGTPSFFVNGKQIVGAQPYAAIKAAIDVALAKPAVNQTSFTVVAEAGATVAGQPAPTFAAVTIDDDPVLGQTNAPVTIIEFSDFECPFCQRFFNDTFGQIKKDYVDTGKVRVVYRDYPLPFHPGAMPAAQAAACAGEQGKFWEMHDKIFSEQG